MKSFKYIGLVAFLMLFFVSCTDKDVDYGNFPTKGIDFTYSIDGGQYPLDFYVVSTIQFNNTSSKSGAVSWDFGDGNTSNEPNPKHKYEKAGLYQVTMTLEGEGKATYPLMIYDIAPVLSVAQQSAETVVINDVTVEMNIFLPNPENLICKYTWIFPEGTTNEAGEVVSTWTGYSHEDGSIDYPGKLSFKNIGSQKIEIQTIFDYQGEGERRLEDAYANVQVGCNYPCKTIYYAVVDGNIMAYKLVDMTKVPEGTKVGPFDMGVKSGSMPTQLVSARVGETDYIYIVDCGKQYYYVNDIDNNLGDGKISVMTADGASTNVMITNVGGQAFVDPFQACAYNGDLYYTDRGTGIRKIELSARGQVEQSNYSKQTGYFVCNNELGYYGKGIAYGAISTGIYVDKTGTFWWGKNYSGNGIYRFKASDIKNVDKEPNAIVISGSNPRAFTLDENRNKMYVWLVQGDKGFCVYDLPADKVATDVKAYTTRVAMEADPINSTDSEGVYTTQFAVDSDNGNVFFGFRAAKTESTYTTGLKYYDVNTKKIVNFNNNKDKILGVTICDTPSLLF